jgi:hypothetical protein
MTNNSFVSRAASFLITGAILGAGIFTLFNSTAGLVSGIWLLFLGEWKFVLAGFISMLFSNFLLSVFLMPGIAIAALGAWLHQKKLNFIAIPLLFLGGLVYQLVIVLWLGMVFYFSSLYAITGHHILILIFSYSIATAPLVYFLSKEKSNEGLLAVTTASLGYLFVLIKVLFFKDVVWGIQHIGELQFNMLGIILLGQIIYYFANKPKS